VSGSPADDLFARLRRETSVVHAEVEAMVPLFLPSVTVRDYRSFLATLWGFHSPIEQQLAGVADLGAVLPDWSRRRKSSHLAADLAALGARAEDLPIGQHWPTLRTVDRAIGCLYVVEGSTLGGQHIYRHLSTALPGAAEDASRFLTCYGANVGRMWNAFRDHVGGAIDRLDPDEVTRAARETFSAVRDWFAGSRSTAVDADRALVAEDGAT
jgi:heme oxygenase